PAWGSLAFLRRHAVPFALLAALACCTPAPAAFEPLRHRADDPASIPRVRAGTIDVPAGHASGLVTVIVTLRRPPLALAFGRARALQLAQAGRRLDVATRSSRAYLSTLAAA